MTGERRSNDRRIDIIQTVQTPLGFFVLVVLVVEVVLGGVAGLSDDGTARITVFGMIFIILALVAVVALFAYLRPEALAGGRPAQTASTSDESLLTLMKCHSKEVLTVVRVESAEGRILNAKIVGANDKALHYFGFRSTQAHRLIGQSSSLLFDRLSRWMPSEDFRAFKEDQKRTFSDLDRGYEAYAKIPMVIDNRHPFKDLHGRRFLPITIAHSAPETVNGNRLEDILVGYFQIDEIVKELSPPPGTDDSA